MAPLMSHAQYTWSSFDLVNLLLPFFKNTIRDSTTLYKAYTVYTVNITVFNTVYTVYTVSHCFHC